MKHIVISTLCSALSLFAMVNAPVVSMADPITPTKALQLAKPFIRDSKTPVIQLAAKRSGTFDPSLAKGASVSNGRITVGGEDASAPYYIISRGAGQGFIVVSGDDCIPQILAVIDNGDFDECNIPDDIRDWLQWRAGQVEYAQSKGTNTPFVSTAAVAGRVSVPVLMSAIWGQGSPYNDKCPKLSNGNRAATGCVATASSQIAYYWRRDANTSVQYNTPTYSYGDAPATSEYQIKKGTPLRWDLMKDDCRNISTEGKDAVATLVAMIGMSGYLQYGSSTGGQIENQISVLSGQIGLNGGNAATKSDDTGWSELLYNQLIQGRPLLYCGYSTSDYSEGHAVVCDGYDASTGMFHINKGWDGGWNGYFSLEDGSSQGWGFNYGQRCIYNIYAKHPNVTADIDVPSHVYKGINTEYNISIQNNSTLPLKGVYLFIKNTAANPTALSDAKSSYTTEIPVDGKASFTLSGKTVTAGNYYLFVTDASLNVLKKVSITSEKSAADLHFKAIDVAASSDTEELDGELYSVVYNTSTTVNAQVENQSDIPFSGFLYTKVYGYNDATKSWDEVGHTVKSATIEANSTGTVPFTLKNGTSLTLQKGRYYYAVLSDSINASKEKIQEVDSVGNIARFVIKGNDMQVVSFADNILTLKGHFDPTLFNSSTFAAKTAYKTAVGYDLTQCQSINAVSQSINPNALYYVSSDSKATGNNIVRDGKTDMLVLTPGYDFVPQGTLTADSVEVNAVTKVAQWYMITPPVNMTVPLGMAAREINGHYTSAPGLLGKTTDITTLEAGKTYLLMTSSSRNTALRSGASTITATPATNKDVTILGTFVNATTAAGGLMLDESTPMQYLQHVTEGTAVEALRGYMLDPKVKSTVSLKTYHTGKDSLFIHLAKVIDEAYDTYDKYSEERLQRTKDTLLAAIKTAEEVFTYRTSDYSVAKPAYQQLQAACKRYVSTVILRCDMNEDEKVDYEDVRIILADILGEKACPKADVNEDGLVDILDVNIAISETYKEQ